MKTVDMFRDFPSIETSRLLLRKLEESDSDAVFRYASNPNVAEYTSWNAHQTIEESKQFLNRVIDGYKNSAPPVWGIVVKEEKRVIGTIGFLGWDNEAMRISLGYAISQAHWNRGFTTEAAQQVVKFGFERLKVNKICACCDAPNIGSERVMQKLGMQLEGIFREQRRKNGKLLDDKHYGLLANEYQPR